VASTHTQGADGTKIIADFVRWCFADANVAAAFAADFVARIFTQRL
jgi:hypothetical protein